MERTGLRGRVLITDAGYKHTLGAVRCLGADGYLVDALGGTTSATRYSRWLRRIALPHDDLTTVAWERLARVFPDYDVFLPIGARSVRWAAWHRDRIAEHCSVPVPRPDQVEQCLDKWHTTELARHIGLTVPRTWQADEETSAGRWLDGTDGHLVVKGRNELEPLKPVYVRNAEELAQALRRPWREPPLIQQYIAGEGHGFFALFQHGQCKRVFMHRRVREVPPSGGVSACAESMYDPDLRTDGRRILEALEWHGVAMVEFRREHRSGRFFLLEINPKFWGSLELAIASGVRFPTLAVRMALGEHLEYSERYEVGRRFHWWFDHGELRHLLANPRALAPVLRDTFNRQVRSNVQIRDPLASGVGVLREVASIARGAVSRRPR